MNQTSAIQSVPRISNSMAEQKPLSTVRQDQSDYDDHAGEEINGDSDSPRRPLTSASPGPRLIAPNGGAHGDQAQVEVTNQNGRSNCDSQSKIVIKSMRPMVNDAVQELSLGDQVDGANDVEDIQRLFETKPEAFRQWLTQRAPSDLLMTRPRHQEATSSKPFASSDLFHRWIAFSPTKVRLRMKTPVLNNMGDGFEIGCKLCFHFARRAEEKLEKLIKR